jgi:WD40 repeat protein
MAIVPLRRGAFSPDSLRVATAGTDNTIKIWSVESGALIAALAGHKSWVWDVMFAKRSNTLLSASEDKTAIIWDIAAHKPLATLTGHENVVRTAKYSPDEALVITASMDGTARIWDAGTGSLVQALHGHGVWVRNGAFSPDGKTAITASYDQTARLWAAPPAVDSLVLQSSVGQLYHVGFSTSGAMLLAVGQNGFSIWDSRGNKLYTFSQADRMGYATFSPDERFFAASSFDKTVRVWDMASRQLVSMIEVPGTEFFPPLSVLPRQQLDRDRGRWIVFRSGLGCE